MLKEKIRVFGTLGFSLKCGRREVRSRFTHFVPYADQEPLPCGICNLEIDRETPFSLPMGARPRVWFPAILACPNVRILALLWMPPSTATPQRPDLTSLTIAASGNSGLEVCSWGCGGSREREEACGGSHERERRYVYERLCRLQFHSTTSVHKKMLKVCLNSDGSRHLLVYRYIQIWTNLRHPFMDGRFFSIGSTRDC
jgi:hypothetical protein